jgi:DNA-directed RNA polymerase subunit RPC12/RpoP
MPEYDYRCVECEHEQSQFRSMKECHKLDEIDPAFACTECHKRGTMKRVVSNFQVKDESRIRLNGDPKKEAQYEKRAKDPDRARRLRRKKFGTDGISITKSPHYHKEKQIKAQGKSDVDKKEFVKAAAQNPNAVAAAAKAIGKSPTGNG